MLDVREAVEEYRRGNAFSKIGESMGVTTECVRYNVVRSMTNDEYIELFREHNAARAAARKTVPKIEQKRTEESLVTRRLKAQGLWTVGDAPPPTQIVIKRRETEPVAVIDEELISAKEHPRAYLGTHGFGYEAEQITLERLGQIDDIGILRGALLALSIMYEVRYKDRQLQMETVVKRNATIKAQEEEIARLRSRNAVLPEQRLFMALRKEVGEQKYREIKQAVKDEPNFARMMRENRNKDL